MKPTDLPKKKSVEPLTASQRIAAGLAALPDQSNKEHTVEPTAEQIAALETAIAEAAAAAVKAATEPLEAELTKLRSAAAGSEVEAAVAAATTPLQAQITELTGERDTALAQVATFEAEKTAFDEAVAKLATEQAEADAKAQVVEARTKVLADELKWDPKRIEASVDMYAAMSDETWQGILPDLRAAQAAAGLPPHQAVVIPGATIIGGGPAPEAAQAAAVEAGPGVKIDARTDSILSPTNRRRAQAAGF